MIGDVAETTSPLTLDITLDPRLTEQVMGQVDADRRGLAGTGKDPRLRRCLCAALRHATILGRSRRHTGHVGEFLARCHLSLHKSVAIRGSARAQIANTGSGPPTLGGRVRGQAMTPATRRSTDRHAHL